MVALSAVSVIAKMTIGVAKRGMHQSLREEMMVALAWLIILTLTTYCTAASRHARPRHHRRDSRLRRDFNTMVRRPCAVIYVSLGVQTYGKNGLTSENKGVLQMLQSVLMGRQRYK
jgi:hypothetical protein